MIVEILLAAVVLGAPTGDESSPASGTVGHYAVLTCRIDTPPPFESADFICGPREDARNAACMWWQLDVRKGGTRGQSFISE